MTSEDKVVTEEYITISQKEYDRKFRFDYYWKIGLMFILIVSLLYMFWEFRSINKEAMACKNSPFVWGVEKAKEQGLHCTYSCNEAINNPYEINYSIKDSQ